MKNDYKDHLKSTRANRLEKVALELAKNLVIPGDPMAMNKVRILSSIELAKHFIELLEEEGK